MKADIEDWLSQENGHALLQAFLDAFAEQAFYVLDQDRRLLLWSRGAEQLTGHRQEDCLGQAGLPGCPLPFADVWCEKLIHLPHADGHGLVLKQSVQHLLDSNGGDCGVLVCLASEHAASVSQNDKLYAKKTNFQGLLSRSPAMQAVFQIIENAAETTATVLVRGESGAGKELVAKAIHKLSARSDAPFLAINCAALSSSLLESELFGHVRGAFTGAIKDHQGLFQRAHGGTLFLDEVAELPLDLQAKLLRVIQERNYLPVGGTQSVNVDVRLVAATHRSLREEVRQGRFREDLMFRLRVVPIFIPPLRERREDIPMLLWHFIGMHNADNFRHIEKIDPQAMKILLDYHWPGNVRELHNVIEYAFAVGRGNTLRMTELPPEFLEPSLHDYLSPSPSIPREQEADAIRQALQQYQGKINPAAKALGMSRATFWRKRKHYGL
ncbi:hypothetical protein JCM14076_17780 [Methylosoma difficile]